MKLSHDHKVCIYCMGLLNNLVKKGTVKAGILQITPSGIKEYEKLIAEGFKPTEQEINAFMSSLQRKCYELSQ